MKISKNFPLQKFNTFGIKAEASHFLEIEKIDDFVQISTIPEFSRENFLIIGGGSNILFTKNFPGTILQISTQGIEIITENKDFVEIKVQAGENWHNFVKWTIDNNFFGLETLALIPGNIGAVPVQNIGAYGDEVKNHIISVETFNLKNNKFEIFSQENCQFSYRDSIFKQQYKNSHCIASVTFRLQKKHKIYQNLYQALQNFFTNKSINLQNVSASDIFSAVIEIRESKLPDVKKLGNGGSFWKNPIISQENLQQLKAKFPAIPHFKTEKTLVKIPAGWLIENAGWKGFSQENCGVHDKQALVLVNYGKASGQEIITLAEKIEESIWQKFTIKLEREIRVI